MRIPVLLSLLLAFASVARAQEKATESSCVTNCHGKEATAFKTDIHRGVLTCVSCHKGDATAMRDKERSHSKESGFSGKPSRDLVPALCGGCHEERAHMGFYGLSTDQLALYRQSGHGRAVLERGNLKAAVCIDCHGSHGILPVGDPAAPTAPAHQLETCGKCHADSALMAGQNLPSDTVALYESSVHGQALLSGEIRGAPSCSDCHGSHGAAPPGIEDIVQVCGHCHLNTRDYYQRSVHHTSDAMRCAECHEEQGEEFRRSGCTTCHSIHEIEVPGEELYEGEAPGTCRHCHREEDGSLPLIGMLLGQRGELRDRMRETARAVEAAKESGLFLEHEQVFLRDSQRALIALQPLSHSLDRDLISNHLEQSIRRQDATREEILKKRVVLRDRRLVLTVAALLLLMFAALLIIKLKALRRLS